MGESPPVTIVYEPGEHGPIHSAPGQGRPREGALGERDLA
jgi:hypothetical protein